jgi:hypothetical protein
VAEISLLMRYFAAHLHFETVRQIDLKSSR